MIERDFSAERLNLVANNPWVRPWLGGPDGPLDFGPVLADTRNLALMTPGGGVLFHFQEPTIYEAHTQFLPEVRGAQALRATQEALWYMFIRTDALEILSKASCDNAPANRWAVLNGGKLRFSRKACWGPGLSDMNFYALSFEDWKKQNEARLCREGQKFHERLETLGLAAGHAECPAHNCAVGAAFSMFAAGQSIKAVVMYNRWARFAGYGTVSLCGDALDIGTAKLVFRDGVLECL